MAGMLVIGTLGQGQGTPATAVSEDQINAGLQVLQNTGNPTPLFATTVKGSKSNSDNILGATQPLPNVTGSGKSDGGSPPVVLSANLNLSKSNINKAIQGRGDEALAVGVITLPGAMSFKQGPEKKEEEKRIAAGQYEVWLFNIDEYATPILAMFSLETGDPTDEVLSVDAQALIEAISDEFTHAQGIPCLLGDEYAAAILLNVLASMLEEAEETAPSAPDVTLKKTLDGALRVEQEATYILTIANEGQGPTTSVIIVTDVLASELAFVRAKGTGWSCAGGQAVTCTTTDSLAPNQSNTIQITVKVRAGPGTNITNCALVNTEGDANPANNRRCHTGTVQ